MRINQNIAAFNAYRNLNQTSNQLSSSLEKLSSGFRINRAADDASGLVRSESLRSQVGGLKMAVRNAQDGISLIQTAEGALTETTSILQRMRDLAVQSANGGANSQDALDANQAEFAELTAELDRIAEDTKFGDKTLLAGGFGRTDATFTGGEVAPNVAATTNTVTFTLGGGAAVQATVAVADYSTDQAGLAQAVQDAIRGALAADGQDGSGVTVTQESNADGDAAALTINVADGASFTLAAGSTNDGLANLGLAANTYDATGTEANFQLGSESGQQVALSIGDMRTSGLGLDASSINSEAGATAALETLDAALSTVSTQRAQLGAFQNRFESTIRNINVTVENLSAAESRIRDTDMASEMVSFTRNQILQQAGTAMLAQANQVPQSVLSLLR